MDVFDSGLKVTLFKTIKRDATSFSMSGAAKAGMEVDASRKPKNIIDLTPFLGEGASVKTSNSVRGISGDFTISIAGDKISDATKDSVYAMVEPMDVIEIRFAHSASEYNKTGAGLPVMMRGFVSGVNRDTSMGDDGRPNRTVSIAGSDYGKLIEMFLIYYLNNAAMGAHHLTMFDFFRKYGDGRMTSLQTANSFLSGMTSNVLNPYLKRLLFTETSAVDGLPREFDARSSVAGTISPFSLASMDNVTLAQMFETILDIGAFNELYIEDEDDKVALVLRPAPFLTAGKDGSFIQPGAWADYVDVYGHELQSMSEARSDRGIANFFWVSSHNWALLKDLDLRLEAQSTKNASSMMAFDYPNCSLDRYNLRRMEVSVNMGPASALSNTGNGKAVKEKKESVYCADWLSERRKTLMACNKDNVVFESGTMRLRGNERVKHGRYIRLKRGDDWRSLYYAVSVDHEYHPFVGYFTTVQYERGTGFIDRVSQPSSPYFGEYSMRGSE